MRVRLLYTFVILARGGLKIPNSRLGPGSNLSL